MIYEQRAPEPSDPSGESRPWQPPDTPISADVGFAIEVGDRYVAVDRIDFGVVTLAVAAWPLVDSATGRLDFGPRGERETATVPLAELADRVDAGRRQTGQLVRPIRAGDVFLVRGYGAAPAEWGATVDVTRAGRLAAKAALFATAAPAPTAESALAYGLEDPRDEARLDATGPADSGPGNPPPPGPVAYPSV